MGYFRSSGYFALRPHLTNLDKIRVLVGVDVDEHATRCQERGLLFDASANYGIKTGFNQAFIIDEQKRTEILPNCTNAAERKRTDELLRPILRGRDIAPTRALRRDEAV